MQHKRGKVQNSSEYSATRKSEVSCFKLILLVFLLSSCSVFKTRNIPLDQRAQTELREMAQAIDLNGRGKGEFRSGDDRLVFRFTSEFDAGSWDLMAQISGHGNEDMGVDWRHIKKGKVKVKGRLFNSLLLNYVEDETKRAKVAGLLGKTFYIIERLQKGQLYKICYYRGEDSFECESSDMKITLKLAKQNEVRVTVTPEDSDLPFLHIQSQLKNRQRLVTMVVSKDVAYLLNLYTADLFSVRLLYYQ